MKNRCKRQKALFGIISGIIGARKQKKQAQAQAQAAKIQAANQQAAINQQMANAQAQIDANYQQQLAEVEAQEKLNQEQNELSAQKVGMQSAQSLTQAFGNTADIDKEFKNRFMRYGGRKKCKCGGRKKAWLGIASAIDSGIGNVISAATAQTGVPAYKLDYSGRLKYHDPVVANLEVDKSIANSYTGKQVGQNNAQYAGVSSIGNNNINNMPTMRFRAGGKSVFRNRSKRKC
jgi:hypothetical protein